MARVSSKCFTLNAALLVMEQNVSPEPYGCLDTVENQGSAALFNKLTVFIPNAWDLFVMAKPRDCLLAHDGQRSLLCVSLSSKTNLWNLSWLRSCSGNAMFEHVHEFREFKSQIMFPSNDYIFCHPMWWQDAQIAQCKSQLLLRVVWSKFKSSSKLSRLLSEYISIWVIVITPWNLATHSETQ